MTLTGLDKLPPQIADVLLRYRDEAHKDGRTNPNITYSDAVTDLEREVCTAISTALAEARVNGVIEGVRKVKDMIAISNGFQTAQERIDVVKHMTDDDLDRLRGEIRRLIGQEET